MSPRDVYKRQPDWSGFQDFLKGEVRYASVMKQYPQEADELFKACLLYTSKEEKRKMKRIIAILLYMAVLLPLAAQPPMHEVRAAWITAEMCIRDRSYAGGAKRWANGGIW